MLLPLLSVAGLAPLVRALVPRLLPDDLVVGRRAAALGLGLFGVLAGHDALGPDLGGDARVALGWGFGGVLGLLGAGLTLPRGDEAGKGRIAAMVLGLALGFLPAAFWFATERTLAFEDVDAASEERARWRRRLSPTDARAWLALALRARSKDQNDHALALGAVAETLETEDDRFQARILELRADVWAAEGDCERARALFTEALKARARAAMETLDLDLGESYRLPPAFAANCRLDE